MPVWSTFTHLWKSHSPLVSDRIDSSCQDCWRCKWYQFWYSRFDTSSICLTFLSDSIPIHHLHWRFVGSRPIHRSHSSLRNGRISTKFKLPLLRRLCRSWKAKSRNFPITLMLQTQISWKLLHLARQPWMRQCDQRYASACISTLNYQCRILILEQLQCMAFMMNANVDAVPRSGRHLSMSSILFL
jgi:hypothetical protein